MSQDITTIQHTPSDAQIARRFTTTVLGTPRIGPNRELKRAVEGYWAGRVERAELNSVAADLRRTSWEHLRDAGLDSTGVHA